LRKGLRIAGIGVALIILLLVALRLAVPVVGVRIANSQLSELLGTEVRIGKIELALLRGAIALKDLRIQQPEGFGQGDLLVVPGIRAKVKLGSLLDFPIRIKEVLLQDARIQVVRNKARELDLDAIISAVTSSSEGEEEDPESEPQESEEPPNYPFILQEVTLRNLSVCYKDYSHGERPYEANIEHLTFVVNDLSLEAPPGKEDLSTAAEGSEETVDGGTRASLVLRNIRIDQPPGFGEDPMLTIPEVDLKISVPHVFMPHLTVEELGLKDIVINLARNRSGRLNMEAVLSEAVPHASETPEIQEPISSGQAEDGSPLDWSVHLKRFAIEGVSVLYTDSSFQDEPLEMKVGDVSLKVANLLLESEGGPDREKDKPSKGNGNKGAHGARGSLVLRDVQVDQPRGFSGDTVLAWPEFKVDFVVDSLAGPRITIEQADLHKPRVHLAFDKDRRGNISVLMPKATPSSEEASAEKKMGPPEDRSDEGTRIQVRKFAIEDLGFAFTDSSYEKKPLDVRFEGVDLELANLTYDPAADQEKKLPGTLRLTGRRVQKPFADALVGLYARIGVLGEGIPSLNGSIQMGGIELEPLSHVLPTGTEQAVGGDAVDTSVDLALAADTLDCTVKVKSIGGSTLSLGIAGTPEEPEVDASNAIFLIYARSGGAVGNVVGKFGGAGLETADTAARSVKVMGKGTAKTLGSAGGGLFHTAKGVATADVDKIGGGLKKTTAGTVKEGVGTATGTVGEVKDGAVDVGTASIGAQQAKAWRDATQERWAKAWRNAQTRVDKMPYPAP